MNMKKKTIITILLALVAMTSIVAQDMIKTATASISFSKEITGSVLLIIFRE